MMDAEQLKRAGDHPASSASLRDYFAAKAMQALIGLCQVSGSLHVPNTVQLAYEIADAMLAIRVGLDARGQE
jgi:hypothetical protein